MRLIITLSLLVISLNAFASFEKVTVRDLNFSYEAPYGVGTVSKVGIGMSLRPDTYNIEITKTDNSFELNSPYVDFSWKNPARFVYDLESLEAVNTSGALGDKTQFIKSELLVFRPKDQEEYRAEKVDASCEGYTTGSFEKRFFEDCRKNLNLKIAKVKFPSDFVLYQVAQSLPPIFPEEIDIPADNVLASVKEGELYLQLYVKYWFYAGIRTWGFIQYEDNYRTLAIRVDTIKFGYLPVTSMVMNRLKEIFKDTDVKVDPPWIRISMDGLHETN